MYDFLQFDVLTMAKSNETVAVPSHQRMRKYRKAPVVEALCEIFFDGSEWDEAVVGEFYGKVKKQFPIRQQLQVQQPNLASDANVLVSQMQFFSEHRNSLLQLRKDVLVINQLQPYPTFAEWQPNIEFALNHYWEVAKPRGVKRIALRYINNIVLPQSPIQMEDYFTIHPKLPENMGDKHGAYVVRLQIPCEQERHVIIITLASTPADDPPHTAHLLDLYAIFQPVGLAGPDVVIPETTAAHGNIEKAFEGSITERLRKLFEPI